jgi:hypothetical protein
MPPLRSDTEAREARDVMAFGQEVGRVLSDGRIVGRAEPFAKVFPSSRVVKRAVGLAAWAVLEDIALDATLDAQGRLVAETNVRRIADNLGLNKDTVTKYLRRLREYGFVLQEETRDDGSGRYETCRYVLDPSACVERFTHTPSRRDVEAVEPCPKVSDTVTPAPVSEDTGHGGFGHLQEDLVVAFQEQQQQTARDVHPELWQRLLDLGVAPAVADDVLAEHAPERVRDVLDAVAAQDLRSPAGWVVKALRDGWDVSQHVAERHRAREREQREAERAAAASEAARAEQEQQRRADGWAAAVSAALDDDALLHALRHVTTPLPGLDRRSVPIARAQLLAWAIAMHMQSPDLRLDRALAAALADSPEPVAVSDRGLPPPPAARGAPADLSSRISAHLDRLEPATAGASQPSHRRDHR